MRNLVVLMPFKNAARYVSEAIESVLVQTFEDFALLAIDDDSSDETGSLIKAYDDTRISMIKSGGKGISAALNTGLSLSANYSLAARHDADDVSYSDRFAEQVAYLQAHRETVVLATQADRIDASGLPYGKFTTPCDYKAIREALKLGNPICHGSVMFRPGVICQAGGYSETYPCAEGYELWVRLAQRYILESLPRALYQYRIYEDSWSRGQRPLRDQSLERVRKKANTVL